MGWVGWVGMGDREGTGTQMSDRVPLGGTAGAPHPATPQSCQHKAGSVPSHHPPCSLAATWRTWHGSSVEVGPLLVSRCSLRALEKCRLPAKTLGPRSAGGSRGRSSSNGNTAWTSHPVMRCRESRYAMRARCRGRTASAKAASTAGWTPSGVYPHPAQHASRSCSVRVVLPEDSGP